jgi:hypothetical protein
MLLNFEILDIPSKLRAKKLEIGSRTRDQRTSGKARTFSPFPFLLPHSRRQTKAFSFPSDLKPRKPYPVLPWLSHSYANCVQSSSLLGDSAIEDNLTQRGAGPTPRLPCFIIPPFQPIISSLLVSAMDLR